MIPDNMDSEDYARTLAEGLTENGRAYGTAITTIRIPDNLGEIYTTPFFENRLNTLPKAFRQNAAAALKTYLELPLSWLPAPSCLSLAIPNHQGRTNILFVPPDLASPRELAAKQANIAPHLFSENIPGTAAHWMYFLVACARATLAAMETVSNKEMIVPLAFYTATIEYRKAFGTDDVPKAAADVRLLGSFLWQRLPNGNVGNNPMWLDWAAIQAALEIPMEDVRKMNLSVLPAPDLSECLNERTEEILSLFRRLVQSDPYIFHRRNLYEIRNSAVMAPPGELGMDFSAKKTLRDAFCKAFDRMILPPAPPPVPRLEGPKNPGPGPAPF